MRLLPSDPDVETIVSRIEAMDLNLQPDFQRGEVWSRAKKQRLVDSILREWHVPPIHVIEVPSTRRQEVLDGQQRLVAIRDFHRNEFPIDGSIEPKDPHIAALDGLRYRDLPEQTRRQFNQFTIRVFRIVDFDSSEPAELFFRLNQPTNLTSAEQRNAYFGPVREQIKTLVESLERYGLGKDFLGFSNARMAYDDVLCRVALSVQRGSIAEKITSNDLVQLYRSPTPLGPDTIDRVNVALQTLGKAQEVGLPHPRFNKATLYSWTLFVVRARQAGLTKATNALEFASYLEYFESISTLASLGFDEDPRVGPNNLSLEWLLNVYADRSTSRVADVSSVVLRDLVLWLVYGFHVRSSKSTEDETFLPDPFAALAQPQKSPDPELLARAAVESGWGRIS